MKRTHKIHTRRFRVLLTIGSTILTLGVLWGAYYVHVRDRENDFLQGVEASARQQAYTSAAILSASAEFIGYIEQLRRYSTAINEEIIQNQGILKKNSEYSGIVPDIAIEYMRRDEFGATQNTLIMIQNMIRNSGTSRNANKHFIFPHTIYIVEKPADVLGSDLVRILSDSFVTTYASSKRWLGLYARGGEALSYDSIFLADDVIFGAASDSNTRYFSGAPFYNERKSIIAALVFEYDIAPNEAITKAENTTLVFLYIAISGAYILLLIFVNRLLFKPLKRLLYHARRLQHDDWKSRAYLKTKDEFETLGNSMDSIAERLNSAVQEIDAINRTNRIIFPSEYLEYLNKKSISELEIGEYAERYMNILSIHVHCAKIVEHDFSSTIELLELVNDLVGYVGSIIQDNAGFIEMFSHDEMLVLFPYDADLALDLTKRMQNNASIWNEGRIRNHKPSVSFNMALHRGAVAFSIVGEKKFIKPYATSGAIQSAKKLSTLANRMGTPIMLTDNFNKNITQPLNYQFRYLGSVLLGMVKPIQILEEIGAYPEQIKKLIVATKIDFEEAVRSFEKNYLKRAQRIFNVLVDNNPQDSVAQSFKDHLRKRDVDTK